jgi:hypothetical protein
MWMIKLESEGDYLDFMLEAEHHEDEILSYQGNLYKICGIAEFIRDYTFDTYTQNRDLDDAIANGLLIYMGKCV